MLRYKTFARPGLRHGGIPLTSTALTLTLALAMAPEPTRAATPPQVPGNVDAARLLGADKEPQNWFTGGRDKDGSYYSPLASIDAKNVKQLGFAWQYDLGDPMRGQEATPIVIDGVMYTSGTWGYVYAVDAATGRELWRYDPKPDYFTGRHPCCDLVNRGVAVWKGKVYVASTDGRLHALNAATGKKIWEADTITDHKLPYSSTGAPQIAGSVVVIGNGGADMGHTAVRGYVAAYDLETGAFKWRFYTVPPAVGQPYENPELAQADKTWDPHRKPELHGGGTAWDGFAYDPALNLVAGRGHRPHGLVLPDHAARQLGLRLGTEIDSRRVGRRRHPAVGDHAGLEERLLLRPRSQDGQTALRQELYLRELGFPCRHEDGTAGSDGTGRLVFLAQERVSLLGGRAHLESHVL